MSRKQRIKHMTPEELKSKLYAHFERNGSFAPLEAQLRGQMLTELFKVAKPTEPITFPNSSDIGKCLLPLQVCNWLVYDHMSRQDYQYSLSIFVSEAQLPYPDKFLTAGDVLRLLGFNHETAEFESISQLYSENNEMGYLHSLLLALIKALFNVPSKDSILHQNQKDNFEIDNASKEQILNGNGKLNDSGESIKQSTMRNSSVLNDSIKSKRFSMDGNIFSSTVKSPEESFREHLQSVKEENEKEVQKLRHRLLKELENLHNQERKMQLEVEFTKAELKKEQKKLEKESELLKEKKVLLEKEMAHKFELKMRDVETEFASKLHFKEKDLETLKTKLSEKEQKLIRLETAFSHEKDNLNIIERELQDLRDMNKTIQDKYSAVLDENTNLLKKFESMADYSILKEELSTKSREVLRLQNEIRDIHQRSEAERKKYVETVRSLEDTLSTKEPQLIQTEKELNDVRNSLSSEKSMWNKERMKQEQELTEIKNLYRNVIEIMEDQREDIQDLQKTNHILYDKITNNCVNIAKPQSYTPSKSFQTSLNSNNKALFTRRNTITQESLESYKDSSLQFLSDAKSRLGKLKQEEDKVQDKYSFVYSAIPENNKPFETYCNNFNVISGPKSNIEMSNISKPISNRSVLNFDDWFKTKMSPNSKSPYSLNDVKSLVLQSIFPHKNSYPANFDVERSNASSKEPNLLKSSLKDDLKETETDSESQYRKYESLNSKKSIYKDDVINKESRTVVGNSVSPSLQISSPEDKNSEGRGITVINPMQDNLVKNVDSLKSFQQKSQTFDGVKNFTISYPRIPDKDVEVLSATNKTDLLLPERDFVKKAMDGSSNSWQIPQTYDSTKSIIPELTEKETDTESEIMDKTTRDKNINPISDHPPNQKLLDAANMSKDKPSVESSSTIFVNLDDAWKRKTSNASLFPYPDKTGIGKISDNRESFSEFSSTSVNKPDLNIKLDGMNARTENEPSVRQKELPILHSTESVIIENKIPGTNEINDDKSANISEVLELDTELDSQNNNEDSNKDTTSNVGLNSNLNAKEQDNAKFSEKVGSADSMSELSEVHFSCGSEPEQQKEDSDAW